MRIPLLTFCLFAAGFSARAGFSVPKHAFTIDRMGEAAAEAVKSQQTLAFLKSDAKTTCPLCENATEAAFKELRRFAVIVYIPVGDKSVDAKLSPLVREAFNQPASGRIIPKAVLVSPDQKTFWGHIKYEDIRSSGGFRDARKNVEAYLKGTAAPPPQPAQLFWGLKQSGNGYRGSFVGMKDGKLGLKIEKQEKPAYFNLEIFEPGVLDFVKILTGDLPPAVGGSAPATGLPVLENWSSSEGKVISAIFVSLLSDQITLRGEQGQVYTFPISRLSPESQARAKALGAR